MALSLEEFRDRIFAFRTAWKQLAPETKFHDLDLGDFEEQTEESLRLREKIQKLETSLAALRVPLPRVMEVPPTPALPRTATTA